MQGDNNMAPHDLVAPQPVESEVIIETRGLSRVYPGVTAPIMSITGSIEIRSTC